MTQLEQYVSTKDAAALLGCSVGKLRRLTKKGLVPGSIQFLDVVGYDPEALVGYVLPAPYTSTAHSYTVPAKDVEGLEALGYEVVAIKFKITLDDDEVAKLNESGFHLKRRTPKRKTETETE